MKYSLYALVLIMASIMVSCGNPYKYLGKSYAPTTDPEMFFRDADVPADFEQMGKLEVTMSEKKNMDKIQKKLVEIAATKGADAVMIDNFDMETGGFTTVTAGSKNKNKGGDSDFTYGASAGKTKVNKDIVVQATLLKFKDNIPARQ